jgi:hypothetical protein
VEACGSHADLYSKGFDPKHLVGLIKAENDGKQDCYSYSATPAAGI